MDEIINPETMIENITDLSVAVECSRYLTQLTDETQENPEKDNLRRRGESFKQVDVMSLYDRRNKLIRISRGCMGRCSYCAIRFATGNLVSKGVEEVLQEVKHALRKGFKMITFVAEDIGCYGFDSNTNFVHLLKEILNCSDDFKLQLHAINIQWMKKYAQELGELLARNPGRDGLSCPVSRQQNT